MKTLRLKLISLIAMVCLVLGLVVVGICAAEIQHIKLGGNVVFDIGDKTLYLQDVLIKGNDSDSAYSLKDKGKFVPGYVEEQFSMNLGEYSNNNNSFEIYYDIINTVDEEGNTYVYGVNATSTQEGVTFDYSIDNEYGVILNGSFGPGEITPETPATSRLTLTVNAPTETIVDLNQITITFTDPVYHDFTFTTDDQTGTATLDSYTGNSAEVIIPNTISVMTINDQTLYLQGNQYDVTAIRGGNLGSGVFYNNRANLTSVTLPDTLQTIGAYTFYDCDSLTSITLPENITSIGDGTFRDCSYLTEINYNIPSLSDLSVTNSVFYNAGQSGEGIIVNFLEKVKRIPSYLFYQGVSTYSPQIKEVNFMSGLISIGDSSFEKVTSLVCIDLSESMNLTNIGSYAFCDCSRLEKIILPENLINIYSSAFFNCSIMSTVNYLGTMSQWCAISFANLYSNPVYYAESLVIDGEVLENFVLSEEVTSIGAYAFAGYSKLKSVTLPETLQTIGAYAFSSCDGLTSITFPDTLQTIGAYAFYYCSSLTSIDLSKCTNLNSIGTDAFLNCTSLNSVVINEYVFSNVTSSTSSCGYILAYLQSREGKVYVPEAVIEKLGHTNAYLNSSFTLQSDTAVDGYYIYVKN